MFARLSSRTSFTSSIPSTLVSWIHHHPIPLLNHSNQSFSFSFFLPLPFHSLLSFSNRRYLHVAFFGSDVFSIQMLQALLNGVAENQVPITKWTIVVPTKTRQVGSDRKEIVTGPLEAYSRSLSLPVSKVTSAELKSSWQFPTSSSSPPDLALAASFPYKLPASLIQSCSLGGINVHPSFLPHYRGAAPIQHTILNSDPWTGVTILELDPYEMDAGSILLQERLMVPDVDHIQFWDLHHRLAQLSSRLLVQVMSNVKWYKDRAYPQSTQNITFAPKLSKSIGQIHWEKDTAWSLWCKWRALHPYIPLQTYFHGKPIRFLHLLYPLPCTSSLLQTTTTSVFPFSTPGLGLSLPHCILIPCQDPTHVLQVTQLQKLGQPPVSSFDFYHGLPKSSSSSSSFSSSSFSFPLLHSKPIRWAPFTTSDRPLLS